jgi:hypothetical protein
VARVLAWIRSCRTAMRSSAKWAGTYTACNSGRHRAQHPALKSDETKGTISPASFGPISPDRLTHDDPEAAHFFHTVAGSDIAPAANEVVRPQVG